MSAFENSKPVVAEDERYLVRVRPPESLWHSPHVHWSSTGSTATPASPGVRCSPAVTCGSTAPGEDLVRSRPVYDDSFKQEVARELAHFVRESRGKSKPPYLSALQDSDNPFRPSLVGTAGRLQVDRQGIPEQLASCDGQEKPHPPPPSSAKSTTSALFPKKSRRFPAITLILVPDGAASRNTMLFSRKLARTFLRAAAWMEG